MASEPLDLDAAELPRATGDWRDIRYAITQADPGWKDRPESERDGMWDFAERVIERFPGLRVRCAHCGKQFRWHQIYRCFDCSAALCKVCVEKHSVAEREVLRARVREQEQEIARLKERADAYDRINTPEIHEFTSAVTNEALYQRERWSVEHDGGKTDADWFWLIGYLAGKALHNPAKEDMQPIEARLHRIVTVAAAAANWHAATLGVFTRMRPGIEEPQR